MSARPDDRVTVDVICLRGGESWSWRCIRRDAAERMIAHTRETLRDAQFRVVEMFTATEWDDMQARRAVAS